MRDITFVTALYNLKRHTLKDNFKRDMDHYLKKFEVLLKQDINLVVYCDEEVAKFVREKNPNVKVIVKEINFPFKEDVDKIRNDKRWYGQASWLKESPQCQLEYYNPLVMSKQFMLNDTSIHNYFNTKYFFWIDAGLANTVNIDHYFDEDFGFKLIQDVRKNKMLYVAFPYNGTNEVHGFKKKELNDIATKETTYVCRGGFFGGTREAINRVNEVYYHLLESTLKKGLMGTEESIFTIITHQRPDAYNVQMIEANGLIGTYFKRVQERSNKKDTEMAFYFLTFNAPQQMEKNLEQFQKNHPHDFETATKYLINNSTKEFKEYDELIKKYNLIEHKFDNIGITGGRIFAAQHFDESDHHYMVFFEDDMLVNGKEHKNTFCKAGFTKYIPDLFEKSISILEENELDYLKLTFTEFFGNNSENWSWHNMSAKDREENLLDEDIPENKTKVSYIGSHNGLSYSVGEYFYCNWPILFSKEGNRKFFIDHCEKNHPESILMAKMQRLLRKGHMKAGVLLASPITHKRYKHYGKGTRIENRYKFE